MKRRATRQRQAVFLRVVRGGFEPAAPVYASMLRERKFKVGDLVRAELTQPRNPGHHRAVFQLLRIIADNTDTTVDALLTILKIKLGRVQAIIDSATGKTYYIPESIDFESMDQGEFAAFHRDLCRVVSRDYLPHLKPDQVALVADLMTE